MTLQFAVVHEHEHDFDTATELADRVLCEAIDWLDRDLLSHQRTWVANNRDGLRLTWTGIKKSAMRVGVRAHGHFRDSPGLADASAARRALEYLLLDYGELDAVVLIRDQDDQPGRKIGLDQARTEHQESRARPVIVIGFAIIEREAWVISGFIPQNDAEQTRIDDERQMLGFNPCERSHELTAGKNDAASRSPKRVLQQLSGGDPDRERRCWNETSLEALRQRGVENGLKDYLVEIQTNLAPLIDHVPRKIES